LHAESSGKSVTWPKISCHVQYIVKCECFFAQLWTAWWPTGQDSGLTHGQVAIKWLVLRCVTGKPRWTGKPSQYIKNHQGNLASYPFGLGESNTGLSG